MQNLALDDSSVNRNQLRRHNFFSLGYQHQGRSPIGVISPLHERDVDKELIYIYIKTALCRQRDII